jgi:hypothetical protein
MIRIDRADLILENGWANDPDAQGQKNGEQRAPESDMEIKADAHLT